MGGHFYNKETFSASLQAITLEHCMGIAVTNTEHPTAPLVLFKLLDAYSRLLKSNTILNKGQLLLPILFLHLTLFINFFRLVLLPDSSELAALAVISRYYRLLEPEQDESEGNSWHKCDCFSRDFMHVSQVLTGLLKDHLEDEFQQAVAAHEEALLKICKHCMPFNSAPGLNNVSSQFMGERLSLRSLRKQGKV